MGKDKSDIINSELSTLLETLVEEVRYGNITLIIQDGKIIQIDKTEKIRI
ncbi:MAG: YezD family protein [Lachnospiraceae bacterium]|nr:YezD family protein [Lachnospiraceae bacterium]